MKTSVLLHVVFEFTSTPPTSTQTRAGYRASLQLNANERRCATQLKPLMQPFHKVLFSMDNGDKLQHRFSITEISGFIRHASFVPRWDRTTPSHLWQLYVRTSRTHAVIWVELTTLSVRISSQLHSPLSVLLRGSFCGVTAAAANAIPPTRTPV